MSKHQATYALCDVNSFYVSCERMFRPDLYGKPVIVLSNNDGCIIALSDEAKALGIQMATPYFEARSIVQKHKVICFSSNYGLYGDISKRFNWVLEQHCDQVASYSVDESFMRFEGFDDDLTQRAQTIRSELWRTLSLPVCIGLGPTKTLAKVANHFAKKHKTTTHGVVDLSIPKIREWALKQIAVPKIWGIGRQLSKKLIMQGIHTAWDLHNADYKTLQRLFSVNMERTILELRGQPCLTFSELPAPKKSILNSRSFGKPLSTYSDLKEAVAHHTSRCCEKLRNQSSLASSITVFLYGQRKELVYYNRPSITLQLPEPTDDTSIFLQAVEQGLRHIVKTGESYKKAGVMFNGIVDSRGYQPDIFQTVPQRPELMQSLDKINRRYGQDTVKFGSLGFAKNWAMRANSCSPHYTSRWQDILKVS